MTRAEQLIDALRQSEFPHLDSLIHLFIGGSEPHGAKVKDTELIPSDHIPSRA